MSKVIKLKRSDLQKIVENVLREQNEVDEPTNNDNIGDENSEGKMEVTLGQDEDGNFYVFKEDGDEPEILLKTN